jgi:polar amino acid transport system substrate-binding protein
MFRSLFVRSSAPIAALALTLATLLSLPSMAWAQATSRLDEIVKRDKLIVATFGTAPPFCYTDEAGKPIGFDIDIARLIAKSLLGDENKVEFVTVTSEGRWPAVNSGRADIGIASTTVYPDRALRVAFTRPYIDSGISVLIRQDANVSTLAQLNNAKFTLANLSNPQMQDRQKRFLPNMKVVTFDTPSAMFTAVKSGQATAMQMDTPVLNWYAANNKELKVLPENLAVVQGNAIFMKPGDFQLWLWMDTMVQEMTAGSRYTEYSEIYKKWFGHTPPPQRFYGN